LKRSPVLSSESTTEHRLGMMENVQYEKESGSLTEKRRQAGGMPATATAENLTVYVQPPAKVYRSIFGELANRKN